MNANKANNTPKKISFFLGIGAQKAGTAWLYNNLKHHQQISHSPLKELHFFDDILHNRSRMYARFFTTKKIPEKRTKRAIWRLLTYRGRRYDWWKVRYSLIPRKIAAIPAYKKQLLKLQRPNTRIIGEITPSYATLPPRIISSIYQHFPDLKLIFILRDPIERDWSSVRMLIKQIQKKRITGIAIDDFDKLLMRAEGRSDYLQTIQNWQQFYPPEQLLILFMDELKKDGTQFLHRIFRFLEVDPALNKTQRSEEVFHKGIPIPITDDIEQKLYLKYRNTLLKMADYFDESPINYPQQWLEKYEEKYKN